MDEAKLRGLRHYVLCYVQNNYQKQQGLKPWYSDDYMRGLEMSLCYVFNWSCISVHLDYEYHWKVSCPLEDDDTEAELYEFDDENEEIYEV